MDRKLARAFLMAPFALVACGGGGGGGGGGQTTAPTVVGVVSKGPTSGASIAIFELKPDGTKGPQIGSGISTGGGAYSITLTRRTAVPILIEASGGSYTDEVTGESVTLLATDVFRTVLAGLPPATAPVQISITPLTTMAAERAQELAQAGVAIASAVVQANTAVAQQYRLDSIVTIPPANIADSAAVSVAERERRDHGLVLAGIAQLANNLGVSAAELTRALAADLSDGVLNGHNGVAQITMVPLAGGVPINLSATAGTSDLQAAITQFMSSPRNLSNISDATIATFPVQAGSTAASSLRVITTALPNWVTSQYGAFQLGFAGGTAPYACSLDEGSGLPSNFTLTQGCVISGTDLLDGGTTRRIYPQFVVVATDSSAPPQTARVPLFVSVVAEPPSISCNGPYEFVVDQYQTAQLANADGSIQPLTFTTENFNGPPLGTHLGVSGVLAGAPTVGSQGDYVVGVCVVDGVGGSRCCDAAVTVHPAPSLTLSVSAATAVVGSQVTLTWSAKNVSGQCFALDDWSGTKAASGSQAVAVVRAGDNHYTLTCPYPNGDIAESVVVIGAANAYAGSFQATGNFTKPVGEGTCTFHVVLSGTITASIEDLSTRSVQVDGGYQSTVVSGAQCINTSGSWNDAPTVSGQDPAFNFTTGSGGVTGTFSGTRGGSSITGTLTFTDDDSSGSASDSVVLQRQ